ncbi:MAG TPA: LysR family transcriptional regulator [Caulobacteraceae bacterium]|nr:LysR family transcriptional regulator [Caulobacteraceae bacterium]
MDAFDWNDVRFFLAVARDGSTLNASRALKVSQPTVARRIAALEDAFGLRLFERLQTGYRLTDQGAALLPEFEAMERAAEGLDAAARLQARRVSGVLKVTTNEILANLTLAPVLPEFRRRYPDLRVEVIATDRFLDLARGEADVALRAGLRPTDPDLVLRLLGEHHWAIYASPAYVEANGRPDTPEDLERHGFVAVEGALGDLYLSWLARAAPRAEVHLKCSSLLNVVSHVKAGHGLGFLPFGYFEDEDLVCCLEIHDLRAGVWLATHERLRKAPRVRAFLDFAAAFNLAGPGGRPPPDRA